MHGNLAKEGMLLVAWEERKDAMHAHWFPLVRILRNCHLSLHASGITAAFVMPMYKLLQCY